MVSTGAKVLGPFKVGDNSRIAANAVVLSEVPSDATAVGVPARVVRIAGEKVNFAEQVDQVNITDPVQKELQALHSRLEWLEQKLERCPEEAMCQPEQEEKTRSADT
jgi:serine O-acetyltransferase